MIYLVLDSCNQDKSICSSSLKEIKKLAPGAKNNLFFLMLIRNISFPLKIFHLRLIMRFYYLTETIDLNGIKKKISLRTLNAMLIYLGWLFTDVTKHKIFGFDSFFKDYFYKPKDQNKNVRQDINTFI
jgi:hypothetical protein